MIGFSLSLSDNFRLKKRLNVFENAFISHTSLKKSVMKILEKKFKSNCFEIDFNYTIG